MLDQTVYFRLPGQGCTYPVLPSWQVPGQPIPTKWSDVGEARALELGAVKYRKDKLPKHYSIPEGVEPWSDPVEDDDGVMVITLDLTMCTYNADTHLESVRSAKQIEIRDAADSILQAAGEEYGTMERTGWDQQFSEAEAYTEDNTASVPMLTTMASARGMEVSELASRIISNRDAWVTLYGVIIGQRLVLQDALDAAVTAYGEAADDDAKAAAIEAVAAIEVVYE